MSYQVVTKLKKQEATPVHLSGMSCSDAKLMSTGKSNIATGAVKLLPLATTDFLATISHDLDDAHDHFEAQRAPHDKSDDVHCAPISTLPRKNARAPPNGSINCDDSIRRLNFRAASCLGPVAIVWQGKGHSVHLEKEGCCQ